LTKQEEIFKKEIKILFMKVIFLLQKNGKWKKRRNGQCYEMMKRSKVLVKMSM
jgi:hypothetical protein